MFGSRGLVLHVLIDIIIMSLNTSETGLEDLRILIAILGQKAVTATTPGLPSIYVYLTAIHDAR